MPDNDCGVCDLVIKCGGVIASKEAFQTTVIRLLCEAVDVVLEKIEEAEEPK